LPVAGYFCLCSAAISFGARILARILVAKSALIIGAGLGGLSTALRLSTAGYQVTLLEKHHQAGGRLNQLQQDGFTFDTGPSFFSMSYEFRELFASTGLNINRLPLNELDPVYSVRFAHREMPIRIHKNLDRLAQEFEGIETDFKAKTEKYLKRAAALFHDTEYRIVKRNYSSILSYLRALTTVPLKHGPLLFRSMWAELNRHYDSEEAKVIFSLVAFFLGATPFDTPAVYALLNYTELQHDGYWNVQGGMYTITRVIQEELESRGVNFVFNTEVTAVERQNGTMTAVQTADGQRYTADVFVSNADAASFRGEILQRPKYREEKLDKLHWTLAPFTIYLGVEGKLENLDHHNYFLGNNFTEYAKAIFRTSVAPEKPYYYVNVSSRHNPGSAPEGCENVFILCPVPDMRYKPNWDDAEKLADTIIQDFGERIGYDVAANTRTRTIFTPIDWRDKWNLYKGSGLGLAHGLKQVGGLRPKNKDEEFGNLYYVGASTVPGTGLPIVVISSKLATERILKDHGPVHANGV